MPSPPFSAPPRASPRGLTGRPHGRAPQVCLLEVARLDGGAGRGARVVATFVNSRPHAFASFVCRAAAPRHVAVALVSDSRGR